VKHNKNAVDVQLVMLLIR